MLNRYFTIKMIEAIGILFALLVLFTIMAE
jgi:hypothetical protein